MNCVHSSAVIGEGVELGEDVTVGPAAVILGPTRIEDACWIGPGAVIGTPPEIGSTTHNRRWDNPLAHQGVVIGARTVVRELSTVHQGSHRPTRIGADCWLLTRCCLAHDCQLGDGVTIAAGASVGGNVLVDAGASIGVNAAVDERRVIGAGSMIGTGAVVNRDVPPYAKALGSPARLEGVNELGMTRAGFERAVVRSLTSAYGEGVRPRTKGLPDGLARAFEWWRSAGPLSPLIAR